MKKQSILKKKERFLLKRLLYQIGKAQNMPVAAGSFVNYANTMISANLDVWTSFRNFESGVQNVAV